MTRGRESNRLHIIAVTLDDAREQFAAALERDRADRGLAVATDDARAATRGLAANGPVKLVTTERARLIGQAERFEAEATRLEDATALFTSHRKTQDAERQEHARMVTEASQIAEQTRQEITARIAALVESGGRDLTHAHTRLQDARAAAGGQHDWERDEPEAVT